MNRRMFLGRGALATAVAALAGKITAATAEQIEASAVPQVLKLPVVVPASPLDAQPVSVVNGSGTDVAKLQDAYLDRVEPNIPREQRVTVAWIAKVCAQELERRLGYETHTYRAPEIFKNGMRVGDTVAIRNPQRFVVTNGQVFQPVDIAAPMWTKQVTFAHQHSVQLRESAYERILRRDYYQDVMASAIRDLVHRVSSVRPRQNWFGILPMAYGCDSAMVASDTVALRVIQAYDIISDHMMLRVDALTGSDEEAISTDGKREMAELIHPDEIGPRLYGQPT